MFLVLVILLSIASQNSNSNLNYAVRERLAVRKQVAQKSDGVIFNLRKLYDLEVRKQYQIEITNKSAALENVSEDEDIKIGVGRTLKKISKPQLQRV